MPHVFISYVREDSLAVDKLAGDLTANGVDVWMDRLSIKPGHRWDMAIREAVRSGDFFIACFSENSVQKLRSGMNQELVLAVDELMLRPLNSAWFIPVLLTRCEVPEYGLGGNATFRSIQYVALYENWRAGIARIIDTVAPNRPRNGPLPERSDELRRLIQSPVDSRQSQKATRQRIVDFGRDAVPLIVETIENPPSQFEHQNIETLIGCLGDIGPVASVGVPTIIRFGQKSNNFSWDVTEALGKIGSSKAVPYLEGEFEKYKNTLYGSAILQSLAWIGDIASLPFIVEGYLGWERKQHAIIENSCREGEDLSLLFPYRELRALTYLGAAARSELKEHLFSTDVIRKLRAASGLATLEKENSVEYETTMREGLIKGEGAAIEALFGLRCFPLLQTEACIQQVIKVSILPDPVMRFLAVKVLRGNCPESSDVSRAIAARRKDDDYRIQQLTYGNTTPLWDEVYYVWSP